MHDGHELLEAFDVAVADIKLLAAVEDAYGRGACAPPEPSSTTVELEFDVEIGFKRFFETVAVSIKTVVTVLSPDKSVDSAHALVG